ncbi:MAG: LysR substrate-binding domain-containing protein [Deferrisomatales bacterium]|nr:LysR substrate-binding domain-containing protein [Deferrisomatales bacterium]
MLNFNQLRAFCEAARCQSFSQAARNLCVTQPAVTGQIRALEEALELRLFKKRGRRMVLSEVGALLFQQAREVFELEKRMERLVAEVRELKRGLLKIGTTKTYARYLMPGLISRFRSAYPQIKVILDEGSSLDVCRTLLELKNELAVVALTEELKGLTFLPFREEEVVLFAAPSHPLARRAKGVPFAALEGELVILKEEGSSTQALVRRLFEDRGLAPTVLLETSNLEFIKEMVEKGEGVSFLVRSAVVQELEEGRLQVIPVRDQEMTLPVYIAYREADELSPAARAFLVILEEERRAFAQRGAPAQEL